MSTLLITGGTGFIGRAVLRFARAAGLEVTVATRSKESAAELSRNAGVRAIVCDLTRPGAWQSEAALAASIIHLAQPPTFGARVTRNRAEAYRAERMKMDALLLSSLDPKRLSRIVYVAGTSYYGDVGPSLRDESVTANPRGWGPYVAPAVETIPLHLARGLPVVVAFPGWVYGDGSWFRDYVLRPLWARKRYLTLGGRSRVVSPIHVDDCARAILFLLEHGEIGGRYFLVDDRPVSALTLAKCAATALGVPIKTRRVPKAAVRFQAGPIVTESLTCDANLSNARLRGLGFCFDYPTIDVGVPSVVAGFRSSRINQKHPSPNAAIPRTMVRAPPTKVPASAARTSADVRSEHGRSAVRPPVVSDPRAPACASAPSDRPTVSETKPARAGSRKRPASLRPTTRSSR